MSRIKTLQIRIDANQLQSREALEALGRAAEILRAGGLVAFPTETVYGLGANALDADAVKRIFDAKQRPSWDPLIVHVTDQAQLQRVAGEIPKKARELMRNFWPGPLTLLLPRSSGLPEVVTAGRSRVGVRMPAHPVATALLNLAQLPIAAPSANTFGRTSPTRAEFVLEDLDGRIDAVIDSGETSLGLESTVVDVCEEIPILYRPGVITREQLQSVCGEILEYRPSDEASQSFAAQPSPGISLRHYAPRARLILLNETAIPAAEETARTLELAGEVVGVMLPEGLEGMPQSGLIYRWGLWTNLAELGQRLFAGLRELDAAGATVILCPLPADDGVGRAIRDRLIKAAR